MSDEEINIRHARKMKKKRAVRSKIDSWKTREKGLLIVHTGKGKGKSTAAFGMVFRALAHGMRVGIVQFIKGSRETGERVALKKFSDQITIFAAGEGFTWETQNRVRDISMACEAWERAKMMILDTNHDMVLCDELNIVLRYDYLSLEDVLETVRQRAFMKHVIITGRNAQADLIEAADLVTEMSLVKHPFHSGIKGQKGIEF
ncbi:MAG: uroporphyrin-III C-methyltransferase [Candidatus Tokpelaia sp. JSC188]|nr:MAG: uroporphyrin-III C-methyltransferase [Candidatus Tokpelaia sp. JSC188]